MYEYQILPVSFKDYDDYLVVVNGFAKERWEIVLLLRTYENSPLKNHTTHDYLCKRKIPFFKRVYLLFLNIFK